MGDDQPTFTLFYINRVVSSWGSNPLNEIFLMQNDLWMMIKASEDAKKKPSRIIFNKSQWKSFSLCEWLGERERERVENNQLKYFELLN